LALNNRPLMQFIQVEFLLNGVVAPPVFIALLSAFTRMRSDYTRARAQAESLRELALLDALTGLPNRRAFGQSFARARARQARTKAPLCVLLLDIDHFKRVNDTHGHAAGDDVLRGLAGVLKRELRGTDEVFRWGGEEFAALLEETPATVLNVVAERVRAAVAGAPLLSHWPVTVSIGATHVAPGENEDTVFARADTALYRSKREGRNRVTVVETALAD
ncbi:MAG: GGDEF domain-containing protein, partial [Planctomycetes bacterium]|nr:GGDEF domain-containing protein [Planctomycetota bacterium]